MKNRFYLAGALVCGLAVAAAPLIAHHSVTAQFDRSKNMTLSGPVHKLDWINPHARILMDVTDPADGKVTRWEIELSAPAMLMRRGWTRNALPIGKPITVNGIAAKDGSKMIYANTITLADGKRVFSGSPEEVGGQ